MSLLQQWLFSLGREAVSPWPPGQGTCFPFQKVTVLVAAQFLLGLHRLVAGCGDDRQRGCEGLGPDGNRMGAVGVGSLQSRY
jgi:hypothetical protein